MTTITAEQQQQAWPQDMAPGPIYVDTQHEDLVHDSQMDFYGAKLATCSSDRTIKIYNVSENAYEITATLQGHEGPVWQVSWAHPKYGVLLASCSFDGSVLIHREQRPGDWTVLHAARSLHESSVNGVAFCPQELGLMVAAASSDGRVSVLQHLPNHTWSVEYLSDCQTGVNAVSWAPHGAYYDTENPDAPEAPRLVTAGCDNHIRFWVYNHDQGQWTLESTTADSKSEIAHSDWVRDVAWSPCLLPNKNIVASCSEDRTVIIWKQDRSSEDGGTAEWVPTLLNTFKDPVWRVSWSVTGHLLAVSSGDSNVSLWKSGLNGKWTQVEMTEDEAPQQQQQQQQQ